MAGRPESVTRLREELSLIRGALEQLANGIAVLDRHLRVTLLNAEGERLLGTLGPIDRRGLPSPLREWAAAAGTRPFHWSTADATIVATARKPSAGEGLFLTLEEHAHAPRIEPLMALRLTRREAEVVWWVAEGKTNAEVGVILQVAHRTVQKHLERVFVKLGVENRTAAAARATAALQRMRV